MASVASIKESSQVWSANQLGVWHDETDVSLPQLFPYGDEIYIDESEDIDDTLVESDFDPEAYKTPSSSPTSAETYMRSVDITKPAIPAHTLQVIAFDIFGTVFVRASYFELNSALTIILGS